MILNPVTNQYACPLCYRERQLEADKKEATAMATDIKLNEKYNCLKRDSIITDKTLLQASFDNYKDNGAESVRNSSKALSLANDILQREVFNVVLNGTPGVGKSHLAYSMLKYVNENCGKTKTCLFIDVSKMFMLIRGTFSDKSSKYTEHYFDNLLSEVDVLVIDDLGAEVGNIDTDKTASDFVGRILRNITTSRQDKVTIYTTNLSSADLKHVYDEKTVSRMFRRLKPIVFKETEDMRQKDWGF